MQTFKHNFHYPLKILLPDTRYFESQTPDWKIERSTCEPVCVSVCVCDWFPDFGSLCVEESTIASLLKLTVVIICLFACLCELEEKSFE